MNPMRALPLAALLAVFAVPARADDPSCALAPGAARGVPAVCVASASPVRAASLDDAGAAALDDAGAAAARPDAASVAGSEVPPSYDTDLDVDPSEPDFTVVDMPTSARLPRHRLAFRLTHRFARALGDGDFGNLASDLFGFDSGAQVGLGLRFGLFRGTQLGIYRTSDRTILLHAQQGLLREGRSPLGLSLVGGVEGLDNFGLSEGASVQLHRFSPSAGLLVSRRLGSHGAVYAEPQWVGNTRLVPSAPGRDDGTFLLSLGARLRVTRSMSLLGEVHPRVAGYAGDLGSGDARPLTAFGVEWTVGGHAFQLNVSNALGTTPAQVARGAQGADGWFVGFNLSRKFY
jgi:hypothetical protein